MRDSHSFSNNPSTTIHSTNFNSTSSIPLRTMTDRNGRNSSRNHSRRNNNNIDNINRQEIIRNTPKAPLYRLRGLLNNSLYVVILTAALELLPKGVPTGVVALANIAPALVAKAIWPYLLKGKVRYKKRVWTCSTLSFFGMLVIAFFPSLTLRLIGISMASFSSGLGELTYLQLSTRYQDWNGEGVGYFASGTGAAGIVGSLLWWLVRPLGVQTGLTLLSILPFGMLASWGLLLPTLIQLQANYSSNAAYVSLATDGEEEEIEEENISREEDDEEEEEDRKTLNNNLSSEEIQSSNPIETSEILPQRKIKLSFSDKMSLLKPMLIPYIFPLVLVYLFEYTINQGIAPTLLYPLPKSSNHPILSLVIKNLKDYYPFYQTVYQFFVFLSRSSVSLFHLPSIPKKFLWLPAIIQGLILVFLFTESLYSWFRESINSPLVIVLICCEGLAGGSAYVSVFYSIGTESQKEEDDHDHDEGGVALSNDEDGVNGKVETKEEKRIRKTQEFEFRIGSVGFGDSLGILIAALIAMPMELWLCSQQVKDGRTLCKEI